MGFNKDILFFPKLEENSGPEMQFLKRSFELEFEMTICRF
jgi:hypothetical protein